MGKIYRLIAFFFIATFVVASFFLVVFQTDIRDYLSTINNLSEREPLIVRPKPTEFDPAKNPLKVEFLTLEKYKDLVKTEVDMTGIQIPGMIDTSSSTTATSTFVTSSTAPEKIPEFKVGNPEPFKSF